MANIPETPQFDPAVYQIETTDKVLGGPDGVINVQAKQLANRTAYLKQEVEAAATVAGDADTKADSALAQIADAELAMGNAADSAAEALAHKNAALAAKALAEAAKTAAEAAESGAAASATGAAADRVTAGQKAAEAQASATTALNANTAVQAAKAVTLAARDDAVAAAGMADSDRIAAEAAAAAADADRIAAEAARDALFNDLASTAAGKGSELVGFKQAGTGAVARTVAAKVAEFVSVKDFGAKGDGVTDDTAAIDAAHAASSNVSYPAGNYVYNGTGITRIGDFSYIGAGMDLTTITIGAGKRWIDASIGGFDAVEIRGFTFQGGAGAIRNQFTGTLVGRRKLIHQNRFNGYTVCAIDLNHNDCPYWDIQRNEFYGANSTSTVGVAMGRNSDVSVISNNSFLMNKVHLKLFKSGLVFIRENDFIQFGSGTQRASIWVTGNDSNTIAFIQRNKFGNENQDVTDYRVIVVPEGAGTYNGDKLPDYATLSQAGQFRIEIEENLVSGAYGGGPLLYSVSNELRGSAIRKNFLTGSAPSYLLQYGMATFVDNYTEAVSIEDNFGEENLTIAPIQLTNVGFYGSVKDSRNFIEGDARFPSTSPGINSGRVGYVEMLTTRINSINVVTGSKLGDITDATGGSEAAEFSIQSGTELYLNWANAPVQGEVFWIEFDLMQGSASPVSLIDVQVYSSVSGSVSYWNRRCRIPANWRTFRFPVSIAGSQTSRFRFRGLSTGQIKIGRLRAYRSRLPVALGASAFDSLVLTGTSTKKNVPANNVFADEANKNILRLSDGTTEQATAGSLTDKQFTNVAAGSSQLVYSLGLTTGYANAVFTFEILGNRNGTGQHTKRKVTVTVSGTAGTMNSVASVGTPTNALDHQDNVAWDFTIAVSVVSGKMQLSVTPTTYVGNFQIVGRWQSAIFGSGGKMVYEN